MNPVIDQETLAAEYGWALNVLQHNPDLKKVFAQAVAGHWDGNRFLASVRATPWFQHTSDTAREWIILQQTDPTTANQRLAKRVETIRTQAAALGVPLSAAQLRTIASQSIMVGYDDVQVKSAISADWVYNPKTAQAGLAGSALSAIKKTSSDYLVPISDASVSTWLHKIVSGQATPDDFTEFAKMQAKSLFPTLTANIDKGETVAQFADPYAQLAAQTLETTPDSINWSDPKWRKALDQVDPKTKERSFMSLADWQTTLRTDATYGYDKTNGAKQQAAQFATKLSQTFGAQ